MRLFFDGKARQDESPTDFQWNVLELDRICYNCGESFGKHKGYICPGNEARSRI